MRERANARTEVVHLHSCNYFNAMFYVVYDGDVEHITNTYARTQLQGGLWSFGLSVHEISQRKRGIEIYRYHTYTVYTIQHRVLEPTVSVCISLLHPPTNPPPFSAICPIL